MGKRKVKNPSKFFSAVLPSPASYNKKKPNKEDDDKPFDFGIN